jgi:hypothetical protein
MSTVQNSLRHSGLLPAWKVKARVLVVLVILMGLVSAPGAADAQRLGPPTRGPGQYDTDYGYAPGTGFPPICAPYAEPTLAVGLDEEELLGSVEQAVNFNYGVYDKTDTQIFTEPLRDFFGNGLLPSGFFIGKPQLLYDQFGDPNGGRFVQAATAFKPTTHQAWITLGTTFLPAAGSVTTDCTVAIDANRQANGSSTNYWADEPRLGMSGDSLVVTAEMKSFADNSPKGAKLWVIPKTSVYNVPPRPFCPQQAFQPPPVVSRIWQGFQNADGTRAVAIVPANSYAVGNSVTYLVSAYPSRGTALNLWTLDTHRLTLSPGLRGSSVPTQLYSAPPTASQPGTSTRISTGGKSAPTELVNAIYQPASGLWTVHTTACPSSRVGLGSCLKWYEITPKTAKVRQQGYHGYTNAYVYAPWILVNRFDDVVVPFNASGSNFYVGTYYIGRYRSDPLNTVQEPGFLLKDGSGDYQRFSGTDEFGHPTNTPALRSGGYVDPDNANLFWILGAYAAGLNGTCPNNTPNYDWATEVGAVAFNGTR